MYNVCYMATAWHREYLLYGGDLQDGSAHVRESQEGQEVRGRGKQKFTIVGGFTG